MEYFPPTTLWDFFFLFLAERVQCFFFTSAALLPSAHRLDYAQGINPGWAVRNNSLQHIVLAQNSRFGCRCWKTHFYWHSAGWEGWPMLLGGCQSVEQEIKGWERTTILWLRQRTATLESDLDCKTKSLWESDTSPKPKVLQVVAICMFLLLWASHTRPSDVIFGRGVSVKESVRNVLPANNEKISDKKKFFCICVWSWLQLLAICYKFTTEVETDRG